MAARREPAPSPPDDSPQSVREVALSDTAAATPAVTVGPADETADGPPPYYIATRPLFVGDQFSRAFNPGDRVPVEHVTQFGWDDMVRRPEPTEITPENEPETTPGQATNSSKDGA